MNLFDQILNQAKLGTPGQFSGGSSFGSINTQDFQSKAPTIQKSVQAEQNLMNQGFSEKEVKFLKLQKEKGVDMNQAFAFVEQKRQEEAKAKNPDLGIMGGLKEGVIGATQFGQQAPSAVGNLLNFTQKYVTTPLIAGGLEMVGAEGAAQKWRSAGEKFGTMAKQSGEQFSSEAMQAFGPLTENQLQARQTGANLALTAPIPLGKVPSIIRGAGLAPTIGRGAYYGAVGTPTYTAVSEGRLPTGGEMATGIVGGAVAGPLLEKVAIPAVSGIANKTQKYGTALVKGGAEGLKKSVSRDLAGIPKAIQSKAEAISTRANRFNALDEEKFTKQIGETPGQFAVSRGMTDVGDDAIVKANQNYQKSLEEADKSIGAIEGKFSTKGQKDDILGELVGANKAKMELQPRNPDANKARQLFNKYESGEGLTMAEINEAKRIYQRNHTYTYEQLASNEARNSKYLQDSIREWQFKTARENGLSNIASINKTTKAWKMWADSLAKKLNRSQANNEFGITDWIALSGGTPENIALFLGKKVLSSKYVKSGIIKALGKQTKPSIIEGTNVGVQQANFQKNVNRGISNNRGDVGGKSMVKPAGLLPAPSGKATGARNVRVNQPTEKTPITNEGQKGVRPVTPKAKEEQKLLPAPRIPAGTSLPRTDVSAESMRGLSSNVKRPNGTINNASSNSSNVSSGTKKVQKPSSPTKFNTLGQKKKVITPQSVVAGERGYTTAIKKPIVKRASDASMETKKLIEEAKKYKSAEEFEKNFKKVYHQTSLDNSKNIEISGFDINKKGVGFNDPLPSGVNTKNTNKELKLGNGEQVQMELFIDKNKIKDLEFPDRAEAENYFYKNSPEYKKYIDESEKLNKEYNDKYGEYIWARPDGEKLLGEWKNKLDSILVKAKSASTNYLKSKGYNAIYIGNDIGGLGKGTTENYIILDPSIIKTKSQLKQIYEQAKKPTK